MRIQTGVPIHAFGVIHGLPTDHVPQLVMSKSMAQVIQSYSGATGDVHRYKFTIHRPCAEEHIRAFGATFGYDPGQDSPAQFVANSPGLRTALKSAGFDCFADWAVLENAEPFQIVVFDPSILSRSDDA